MAQQTTTYMGSATRSIYFGTLRVHLVLDGVALIEVRPGGYAGSTFVGGGYATAADAVAGVSACRAYSDVDIATALQTTAQQIAAKLDNDGMTWRTADGTTLSELVDGENASHENRDGMTRREFADGSAIVSGDGGWDIEGAEKWSWKGME